jgi:hypothetical protein
VVGEVERQYGGVGLGLGHRHPPFADVDQPSRAPHHERPQLEAEVRAVREREVVHAGDTHAAQLGVQARREVPAGEGPPAHPVLASRTSGWWPARLSS